MILAHDEQTIIAHCTPSGPGALALIRISGLDARTVAAKFSALVNKKNKLESVNTHTIHFGYIVDDQQKNIDQVLFLVMDGPQTFTGQDTVEITCHNNSFIIQAIIEQAIKHGARPAQPGEFTKRAFLNNKIDLTQAEAINELIGAHTQQALKKSLAQLEGSFSHWIDSIQKKLLQALTLCEASFEFLEDEDINFDAQIRKIIAQIVQEINESNVQYGHQKHIREGLRIALIGAVNAGKSSLFNALVKQDRAIVTEIAGTTRDVIEAGMYHEGTYLTFVDTAGLRQTHDRIEQEGIKRTFIEAEKADVILLLLDSSGPISTPAETIYHDLVARYGSKIIGLASKCDQIQSLGNITTDLNKKYNTSFLPISAVTQYNLEQLKKQLFEKIRSLQTHENLPFLINQRQHILLHDTEKALGELEKKIVKTIEYELISIHLKDILEKLAELTGKTISELSLDMIFKQFCVGK